ncbi:HEXXH motif domain-containing protein [Nonomuraea sp. MCN248]|uniref:HEXXH motif domain-containing protein n=1 Tax=Nonomuraea corallina TaxID=2989783 RepID=A0ABT4S7T9_9ACTN|nr:HEXXH motif domain-containing protein [Nonomuraea corallina]MDA0633229.1 HEXXH motif domain-containing protein [Nonomuraea corallina]
MTPRPHWLPEEILTRLASGGGGAEAARHLVAAERSKHRLLVLGVVRLAGSDPAVGRAYDLLAWLEKKAPQAVEKVIGHPATGAWATHVLRSRATPDRSGAVQLGALAAAAAARAGLPARVAAPAPDGRIMLPSLGELVIEERAEVIDLTLREDATIEAGGRRVRVGDDEAPGWRPLRSVSADGLSLCVDDLDPFRWSPGDVPDGRLPPAELDTWREYLQIAWTVMRARHWTLAEETAEIVSVLTPITGPAYRMNSATARDRFGAIGMSTPRDWRWLAYTFAHEVQHAKLGAVLDTLELLEPDDGRYYAPWRPDPRPLAGLLQGTYAHLGVAGFWRRQRAHETGLQAHVEFAHWRQAAFEAAGTLLDSGRLTAPGERFVTVMRRTLAAWMTESVPQAALDAAAEQAVAHRESWLARNA